LGGLLHRQHERKEKDKHMKITVEYFVQKWVERKKRRLKVLAVFLCLWRVCVEFFQFFA